MSVCLASHSHPLRDLYIHGVPPFLAYFLQDVDPGPGEGQLWIIPGYQSANQTAASLCLYSPLTSMGPVTDSPVFPLNPVYLQDFLAA